MVGRAVGRFDLLPQTAAYAWRATESPIHFGQRCGGDRRFEFCFPGFRQQFSHMKDSRFNPNSILLGIVLAVSAWTLKEVVALKVSVAALETRLGMSHPVTKL